MLFMSRRLQLLLPVLCLHTGAGRGAPTRPTARAPCMHAGLSAGATSKDQLRTAHPATRSEITPRTHTTLHHTRIAERGPHVRGEAAALHEPLVLLLLLRPVHGRGPGPQHTRAVEGRRGPVSGLTLLPLRACEGVSTGSVHRPLLHPASSLSCTLRHPLWWTCAPACCSVQEARPLHPHCTPTTPLHPTLHN